MNEKTGGPAFPTTKPLDGWGDPNADMTLRDWFAGMALQGYISYMGCGPNKVDQIGKDENEQNKTVIARCAYVYADAMLAEREK